MDSHTISWATVCRVFFLLQINTSINSSFQQMKQHRYNPRDKPSCVRGSLVGGDGADACSRVGKGTVVSPQHQPLQAPGEGDQEPEQPLCQAGLGDRRDRDPLDCKIALQKSLGRS